MRPITLVGSAGVGQSAVCPLDIHSDPFSVFLDAIVSGTVIYNIEYTNDDVWNTTPTNWVAVASMSALSAAAQGSLAAPVRAVRINQTSGAGQVTLRIVQAGPGAGT